MEAEVQKMYLCPKNYEPNCKCNTVNCTNCFHSNYKTLDEAIKSSNLITVFLISQYSTVILVLLHLFVYFSENMVGQDFHQMGETAGSTHSILLLLTVLLHVFSYCGPYWCSLSKTKHTVFTGTTRNVKMLCWLCEIHWICCGCCWSKRSQLAPFTFGLASACSVDIFKRSLQL